MKGFYPFNWFNIMASDINIKGSTETLQQYLDHDVIYTLWQNISNTEGMPSASTPEGEVNLYGGTALLDRFHDGTDCLVVKLDTQGRPMDENVYSAGGAVVTSTLDIDGNFQFNAQPVDANVALVYQIQIDKKTEHNIPFEFIVDSEEIYSLSMLADMGIISPTDQQLLQFNSASGKWKNVSVPEIKQIFADDIEILNNQAIAMTEYDSEGLIKTITITKTEGNKVISFSWSENTDVITSVFKGATVTATITKVDGVITGITKVKS